MLNQAGRLLPAAAKETKMKRILLILVLVSFLPLSLFADLGIGGVAFLNSPVLIGQPAIPDGLGLEDFTFGGNVRWKLGILQLDGLALLTMGDAIVVDIFADAEAVLDLLLFRLSAGIGPNVRYTFGTGEMNTGFNAKVNADVKLGSISVGLSYIMALTLDGGIALDKSKGFLGATVLLWN
jgi:hypothetical protein